MPSATPLCHRWAKTNGKPVDQYSSTMQSGIFAVLLRKESSHPGTGLARTWDLFPDAAQLTLVLYMFFISTYWSCRTSGGIIVGRSALPYKAPS